MALERLVNAGILNNAQTPNKQRVIFDTSFWAVYQINWPFPETLDTLHTQTPLWMCRASKNAQTLKKQGVISDTCFWAVYQISQTFPETLDTLHIQTPL